MNDKFNELLNEASAKALANYQKTIEERIKKNQMIYQMIYQIISLTIESFDFETGDFNTEYNAETIKKLLNQDRIYMDSFVNEYPHEEHNFRIEICWDWHNKENIPPIILELEKYSTDGIEELDDVYIGARLECESYILSIEFPAPIIYQTMKSVGKNAPKLFMSKK